jgi:hypothetical protein
MAIALYMIVLVYSILLGGTQVLCGVSFMEFLGFMVKAKDLPSGAQ